MDAIHISAVGVLASALIRVLAAYLLFYALTRLSQHARVRHVLWMIFVIGASLYWAAILASVIAAQPVASNLAATADGTAGESALPAVRFTVPLAWKLVIAPGMNALALLYVIGVTAMLIVQMRRRRQLRAALSQSYTVDARLQTTFERECARLQIPRCEILELPGIRSPGTAYFWNPVIIIPDDMESYLEDEQIIDVLYHELMHVRRHDFLWNTLAELAGGMLFFHPAMWLVMRNLVRERELACDMAVMDLRQGRQSDYALCLTRLERRRMTGFRLDLPNHLALLSSFLSLRVKTLLENKRQRSPSMSATAFTAGVAILLAFVVGWSSLTLAIVLKRGPAIVAGTNPSVKAHLNRFSFPQGNKASHSADDPGAVAPAVVTQFMEVATAEPVAHYRSPIDPALDRVDGDLAVAGAAAATQKRPHAENRGDEAGSPSAQNTPDWRKTVTDTAVGAAARIASGQHDHDDNSDDRATKPF